MKRLIAATTLVLLVSLCHTAGFNEATDCACLEVPARTIPVPASVSPQMQEIIGRPASPDWSLVPASPVEWRVLIDASSPSNTQAMVAVRNRLHVKVESSAMAGVGHSG